MSKKISVITINYNNAQGLKRTIESVFEQTFDGFEYIVIDGGSTDGSKDLLEEKSPNINYWVSEPDNGVYDAMNKGIMKATGEYLLFINSGDSLFENKTLKRAARFLNPKYDIVYGNMKIEADGVITEGKMPSKITLSQMMNDTLWHPVSFIKKELFIKYGLFSTQYKICGDYDFFFKVIIARGAVTRHINQFICVFELNGMSSDVKNVPVIQAEKEQIRKTYLSDEEIKAFKTRESKKKSSNFITRWFR